MTTTWESRPRGQPPRTRVLIADDDFDVRLLLKHWLERHGSFDVVAEAADGVEALDAARRLRPELAVLDLAMPRMDGLEATAEIRRVLPQTRIVVRSAFSAERMAQRAIDAGADVYVEKAANRAELLAVLDGLVPGRAGTPGGASPPPGQTRAAVPPSTLDLLLDALAVGVLLVDDDGRVRSANFAATVALDVPTSRLVGASLRDLLSRRLGEAGGALDPVSAALASGLPLSGRVLRLARAGGGHDWVSFDVRPVRDAVGAAVTGAVVVVTDVTEDHRLREAVEAAAERQGRVLDLIGTPVVVLREPERRSGEGAWVVEQANLVARALTGWAVGSRVDDDAIAALGVPPRRVADGEVVLAWVPDRTESPWAAEHATDGEPARTADLLEAALTSAAVGTILLDRSAHPVIANPVADRLLDGALVGEAGAPSGRVRRAETKEPVAEADLPVRAACAGVPFDDLDLFIADDEDADTGTYVRISGRPVLGPHGEPVGAVISVLDDTERKETEHALALTHDELRRSNSELATFASVASHDLSQPLQKIYGFACLLQEYGLDDPEAPEHVARIVAGCQRMQTFIEDLLAYSRLTGETHPFEEVDLADVVGEVVELFEREVSEKGARVRVDPLPTVTGDRVQLGHLFQNLIGNALTYVTATVRPEIHVHSSRDEAGWRIVVDDNGIGIDPADRERAFAMFERLVSHDEYAGTGIGLAVCAKIAERHGGHIWIEDSPGGGTRVCVTLPDRPAD